jgi:N-acetyl-1-D-myo-inositol-2-amino-2-deoxy-alpha-D-glucopyranoside deacetylase
MARASFNPKKVLLVHAHPDDESLFTGHVIADRAAAGADVMVLTLTRGERGRVKLEDLKPLEGNLASMGEFRTNELRNALAQLGDVKHKFAGTRAYLDSGMRLNAFGKPIKSKRTDEMSLSSVSTAVISDDIYQVLRQFKPDAVITYNRKGGFGHPDHKKAHEATAMALRRFARDSKFKTPQFWVIAEPRERFDVEVGGVKTASKKKAALEQHASQVSIGRDTYSLVSGREFRFDTPERLRKASTRPWLWLKLVFIALWALPLGILLGFAGTLLHSVTASDDARTPIGLAVALVMTFSLAVALRLLRNSRGALYLMSFTLAGTVFWLSRPSAAGDALIIDNEAGNIWIYGSLIICAVVILFPKLRPGTWAKNASGHR